MSSRLLDSLMLPSPLEARRRLELSAWSSRPTAIAKCCCSWTWKLIGTKLLVYVVGVGRIDARQGAVASFNGEYDLALLVQQRFQPTDDVEAKGEAPVNLAEQLCGYLGTVLLMVMGSAWVAKNRCTAIRSTT